MPNHSNTEPLITEPVKTELLCRYEMRKVALMIMMGFESGNDRGSVSMSALRLSILEFIPALKEVDFQIAVELVSHTLDDLKEVDHKLQEVSPRWKIERMAPIDRSILRLGTYEITDHAYSTIRRLINDYVALGREYGEKNTPAFVNGLLDQLRQNHNLPIES